MDMYKTIRHADQQISPIAAKQGTPVKVEASARCSCKVGKRGITTGLMLNPTCPVHGHGRPAGTIR